MKLVTVVFWILITLSSIWTAFCIIDRGRLFRSWREAKKEETRVSEDLTTVRNLLLKETRLIVTAVQGVADDINRARCRACRDRDSVH